jgi:excisionase family DNA binding protein
MTADRFSPNEEDVQLAQAFLRNHSDPMIPGRVGMLISDILKEVAEGRGFEITKSQSEVWTTQQAANFLGVSRTYFVKLLQAGEIPFFNVGRERRVERTRVEQYDRDRKHKARSEFGKMIQEEYDEGLYD